MNPGCKGQILAIKQRLTRTNSPLNYYFLSSSHILKAHRSLSSNVLNKKTNIVHKTTLNKDKLTLVFLVSSYILNAHRSLSSNVLNIRTNIIHKTAGNERQVNLKWDIYLTFSFSRQKICVQICLWSQQPPWIQIRGIFQLDRHCPSGGGRGRVKPEAQTSVLTIT